MLAFSDLFLEYVPGYNKFRAVSMTLVIAELTIPLLGMLAVREIFDGDMEKMLKFRNVQVAAIITAGIALLFALIPGTLLSFTGMNDATYQQQYPDWFMQAIRDDRLRMVLSLHEKLVDNLVGRFYRHHLAFVCSLAFVGP